MVVCKFSMATSKGPKTNLEAQHRGLMALQVKNSNEPYHASKWLSVALLVDTHEMASLFNFLGSFFIFTVGSITKKGEGVISPQSFLSTYEHYVNALKVGSIPEDSSYRTIFSSAFSSTEDHLYALNVNENSQLIRVAKPVVQCQTHNLDYSLADGKFRPMVFGKESVLWGVQFSYPQLFEDPQTHAVHKVEDRPEFPNTQLFKKIQKWTRENTIPTPFVVERQVVNVPMRLGKACLEWINSHPQLNQKPFKVKTL